MKNNMVGYTYIMMNKSRGTLYVGVTSDLIRRINQHRTGEGGNFTSKYTLDMLVWFERHTTISAAIAREKQIKAWKRDWKIQLIEEQNLYRSDFYLAIARP